MKVTIMELNESPELHERTTLLKIADETIVTVRGLGTASYEWKVHNCNPSNNPVWAPENIMAHAFGPPSGETPGFYSGIDTLGTAMVWVEPPTFAHVIQDILNNA